MSKKSAIAVSRNSVSVLLLDNTRSKSWRLYIGTTNISALIAALTNVMGPNALNVKGDKLF